MINRLMSEYISSLEIPASCFILNKKGHPILPENHESLVKQLFPRELNFII